MDRRPTAEGSGTTREAVVDLDVLDALARELGGGRAVLCEPVRLYVAALPGRRRDLRDAVVEGDLERVRFVVHACRSMSALLGARRLVVVCAAIEEAVRRGDRTAVRRLALAFEEESRRVGRALDAAMHAAC